MVDQHMSRLEESSNLSSSQRRKKMSLPRERRSRQDEAAPEPGGRDSQSAGCLRSDPVREEQEEQRRQDLSSGSFCDVSAGTRRSSYSNSVGPEEGKGTQDELQRVLVAEEAALQRRLFDLRRMRKKLSLLDRHKLQSHETPMESSLLPTWRTANPAFFLPDPPASDALLAGTQAASESVAARQQRFTLDPENHNPGTLRAQSYVSPPPTASHKPQNQHLRPTLCQGQVSPLHSDYSSSMIDAALNEYNRRRMQSQQQQQQQQQQQRYNHFATKRKFPRGFHHYEEGGPSHLPSTQGRRDLTNTAGPPAYSPPPDCFCDADEEDGQLEPGYSKTMQTKMDDSTTNNKQETTLTNHPGRTDNMYFTCIPSVSLQDKADGKQHKDEVDSNNNKRTQDTAQQQEEKSCWSPIPEPPLPPPPFQNKGILMLNRPFPPPIPPPPLLVVSAYCYPHLSAEYDMVNNKDKSTNPKDDNVTWTTESLDTSRVVMVTQHPSIIPSSCGTTHDATDNSLWRGPEIIIPNNITTAQESSNKMNNMSPNKRTRGDSELDNDNDGDDDATAAADTDADDASFTTENKTRAAQPKTTKTRKITS